MITSAMSGFTGVFKPSRTPAHERHVIRAPRRRAFDPPAVPYFDDIIETQVAACSLKVPEGSSLTNVMSKTFFELKASEEDSPVRQRSSSPLLDQALLRNAPPTPKAPITNLTLLKSAAVKRVVKHERGLITAQGYKDELERWVVHHANMDKDELQEFIERDIAQGRDNRDLSADLPKVDDKPIGDIPITETPVADIRVPDLDLSFLDSPPASPSLSTGSSVTSRHSDSPGWFNFPEIDNSPLVSRPVPPVPPLDLSFLITPPSGGQDVKDKLHDLSSFLQEANEKKQKDDMEIKAEEEFWANQSLQDLGNFLKREKAAKEAEICKKELEAEAQYWANQSLQDLGNFLQQEKANKESQAKEHFRANKSLQDLGNYLKKERETKKAELAKKEMEFFKTEKLVKIEKPPKEVRSLPSQLVKPVPKYSSEHISRNLPTVHQELGMLWNNPTAPRILSPACAQKKNKVQAKPTKNIFLNPNATTKKEAIQLPNIEAPKRTLRGILKWEDKIAGDSMKSGKEYYNPYAKPLVPIVEAQVGNGKPLLKIPAPPATKKPANKRMAKHRKFKPAVMASN